jgi:hypothetical protein
MGEILTSSSVTIPNGPLYGQLPGGISRWMAVPWQTDTASCRSGYTPQYDPYVPTFWPARVPNQVLSRENYQVVMNADLPDRARLAAFANRSSWIAPLGTTSYTDQINNMIKGFDHLGVVEANPGPADAAGRALFPVVIQVEDQHSPVPDSSGHATVLHKTMVTPHPAAAASPGQPAPDLSTIDKVRRFPRGLRH